MKNQPKKGQDQQKSNLKALLNQKQKIERQKTVAKLIFPFIANLPTVYDAQTAVYAIAGYIELEMIKKEQGLKISDLLLDLSREKEGEITTAMRLILGQLEIENAKESMDLLKTFGDKLPQFLSNRHLTDPMSTITSEDFIA